MFAVHRPSDQAPDVKHLDPSQITVLPRHPVTNEMLYSASCQSDKVAPFFKLQDVHGSPVQLGGAGARPQFVYFILDGCPCSVNAQPLFNELYQRFNGKVDFVAVTNADPSQAIDYAGATTVLHPIVSDPKLDIMKAYGARESTYNFIIRPDGRIDRMWPGYSQDILRSINARLAQMLGEKPQPIDVSLASTDKLSGCFFY